MNRTALLLLIALLLPVLLATACTEAPHPLTVIFPEAGGLKPGDNVTIRGLAIGQITEVDLHPQGIIATLEITPRYRPHLDAAATFRIENERLITGKMAIVIEPGDPPGPPLPPGATIRGIGPPQDPLTTAHAALTDTVDHAAAETRNLGRALLNPDAHPPRATGATIDLDQPGHHRLRLLALTVEPTTPDGDDWDATSPPDLIVQAWVDHRQVLLTPTAHDTHTLDLTADPPTSALFSLTSALTATTTLRVKVLDADLSFNDEIGTIELRPTPADARAARRFRLAAGRIAELVLVIEEAPPPAPALPDPAEPSPLPDPAP